MIVCGHMDAGATWSESESSDIRCARELLENALRHSRSGDGLAVLRSNKLPEMQRYNGLTLSCCAHSEDPLKHPVQWPDAQSQHLDGHWAMLCVQRSSGEVLAGVLLQFDRFYKVHDVSRALESSFESGYARPGRYVVLESKRLSADRSRRLRVKPACGALAVFHCDNSVCRQKDRQILVPVSGSERRNYSRQRIKKQAFPCSFCPGRLQKRWALTFDGMAGSVGGPETEEDAIYMRFPKTAPFARASSRPGPMRRVVKGMDPRWSDCWDARSVRQVPPELVEGIVRPTMPQFIDLACDNSESALFSAVALDNVNIRAIIECVRQLPPKRKNEAIAQFISLLFTPRRIDRYLSDDDERDESKTRYPYIAMHPGNFFRKLRFYGLLEHPGKFLDVGSGVGEKPFLAYALGAFERCDGLEINPQSLAVAEFLLSCITGESAYPIRYFAADALHFDGYGDYDGIYMYRPFRDKALMAALMRQVTAQLRPGAVVFDVFSERLGIRRGEDGLYSVALTSAETADWTGPIEVDEILTKWGWV